MSLKDRLNLYLLIINVGCISYTTPIFTADQKAAATSTKLN